MNNKRRNAIAAIINKLEDLRQEIEMLQDEEQEAFDNRPENFQQSDAGQRCEEIISQMDDAMNNLEVSKDDLTSAIEV